MPVDGGEMLYDASRAGNAEPGWLRPEWWAGRGSVRAADAGRGATFFIAADARRLVLRHYRRGGLAARWLGDRYWWRGMPATRSFAEWQLLYLLRRDGLQVPVPIAAGYRRSGAWYTADILLEEVPGASTLAERLRAGPISLTCWIAIGRALRRMHALGAWHADLNAHNVLFDGGDRVWLIDFDRSRLRRPGLWSDANLVRLYRSIEKVLLGYPAGNFAATDWAALVDAYLAPPAPAAAAPA